MANNFIDNKLTGDSNREVIEHYLVSDPGTVDLTELQKTLLKRWEYADELIRRNELKREEISRLIMIKFEVSRNTSYQDIVNAENVFASSTPLNKKYRIGLRIEYLENKIAQIYEGVKLEAPTVDEEGLPYEEDLFAKIARIESNKEYYHQAIMMEKVLAKYYEMYPTLVPPRSPKNIVLNIQQNILPAAPMTAAEAIEQAKKIIHLKPREDNG
ncbi:MAG: hypothetical protein ABI675_19515 [Chitinophagaceae bacterium]